MILSVKTREPLEKGEEYFASYGYSIQSAPKWYRNLYREFAAENPDTDFSESLEAIDKYEAVLAKGGPESLYHGSRIRNSDTEEKDKY